MLNNNLFLDIAISDSQKIMEEFVSRLFPHVMNPQNKITYPVEAVHLLKNNISGENLVDFVTRSNSFNSFLSNL